MVEISDPIVRPTHPTPQIVADIGGRSLSRTRWRILGVLLTSTLYAAGCGTNTIESDAGVVDAATVLDCFEVNQLSVERRDMFLALSEQDQASQASTIVPGASTCIRVQESDGALDQSADLSVAVSLGHHASLPVQVAGRLTLTRSVALPSGTRLAGRADGQAALVSGRNTLRSLLQIPAGSGSIVVSNLELQEGAGIATGLLVLDGMNTGIKLQGLTFTGDPSVGNRTAAAVFSAHDWIEDLEINDCSVHNLGYGLNLAGHARDIAIADCEMSGWEYYGIRLVPGANRSGTRSKEIAITNNTFEEPAVGPAGQAVILVSRGLHRPYSQNVTISGNRIVGPAEPYVAVTADTTNALGDTIVLHGIDGFQVEENEVTGGGENGITISRLSRNGTVSQNTLFRNDAFAINIGSGYYEVTVDDTALLNKGDQIEGAESGTSAHIVGIFGNVLALNPVLGGAIFRNESLHNLTTGKRGAAEINLVTRTRGIVVEDNDVYNNAVNEASELTLLWDMIVLNSDSITFHRNRVYNDLHGDNEAYHPLHLSNSRNIRVEDSNVFQRGTLSTEDAVTLTRSSWLARD